MPDLLVRLYALPDAAAALRAARAAGVQVRRANAWERSLAVDFVARAFTRGWADECAAAMAQVPPRCILAQRDGAVVGFACHDVARLGYFGPMGVDPSLRGRGIGSALTLAALAAMREAGYGYAIIGGAGPEAFYARVAGATPIEGSSTGIYGDAG